MTNPSGTSELVARLRGRADRYDDAHPGTVKTPELLREAADTIDRLTSTGAVADPTYRSPREDAAYYGSIWSLSTNQMAELEKAFAYHRDHKLGADYPENAPSSDRALAPLADREKSAASPHEGHVEVPVESEMRTLAEHCAGLMNKLSNRGHTGLMQECPLCQAYIGAARLLAHETDTPMPDEVVIWDRRLQAAALPHNQGETKPEAWDLAARAENGETNL